MAQQETVLIKQSYKDQFEVQAKASISSHKNFSEIREGVWKWEYEKGDDGKFIANYGYYGKNPWWKIIAGGAIAIIIGAVTLGYVIWSPWGMDATLFHSFANSLWLLSLFLD
jgi:hypothetical protein